MQIFSWIFQDFLNILLDLVGNMFSAEFKVGYLSLGDYLII